MLYMKFAGRPSLLAVAALFVCSSVFADQPASIRAAAELKRFSYGLTDLAPDDGVEPGLNFYRGADSFPSGRSSGGTTAYMAYSGLQDDMVRMPTFGAFVGPLPEQTVWAGSTDGVVELRASRDGFTTSLEVQVDDRGAWLKDGSLRPIGANGSHALAQISAGAFGGWQDRWRDVVTDPQTGRVTVSGHVPTPLDGHFDFVLSPHTQVTMSVQLNAHVSVDAGGSIPFKPNDAEHAALDWSGVFAESRLAIARFDPLHSVDGEYADMASFREALKLAYDVQEVSVHEFADAFGLGGGGAFSSGPLLEVTLSNTSDDFMKGSLTLVTMINLGLAAPVPEPGTWVLMGLGLAGVCWRSRTAAGTERPQA